MAVFKTVNYEVDTTIGTLGLYFVWLASMSIHNMSASQLLFRSMLGQAILVSNLKKHAVNK